MALLQGLREERGITVLLVTHEPDIARYAERVITFRDGRVVSDERVASPARAADELAALPAEKETA
jgi:putative ABC transport system ATP-binding protein